MINALELYRQIKDQWDRTDQTLKERATMLPLGQYEDGSVGLAWPGIIADPLQRGYDAANTPIPPINDDAAWAEKSAGMFDAASLAPLAGLGMTAAGVGAPRNALGSAGAKLGQAASDLPMDLASRMARAKEMGFDTENQFYRGVAFANQPELTAAQGSGLAAGPGVYVGNRPTASGYANQYTNYDNTLPGVYGPLVARGKLADIGQFMDAEDAARKLLPKGQRGDNQAVQRKAQELLIEQGYTGVINGPGDSMTVGNIFDPRNIRSVNAAFDPARSDSANLLAANAKSGAALPVATNALERQPQGILQSLDTFERPRIRKDRLSPVDAGDGLTLLRNSKYNDPNYDLKYLIQPDDVGEPVGYVGLQKRDNGYEVGAVEVAPQFRGQGLTQKAYDAIESDLGIQMKPSGTLSPDGRDMWERRQPGSTQYHRQLFPRIEGDYYLSPKQIKAKAEAEGSGPQPYAQAVWDSLPDEAKTPEYLASIFANAPTGSLPGLATQTQEDTDPALLEYLRSVGLY